MNSLGIGISGNGRYFTDKDGSPKFWLGDTQWQLFRCHTLEEAETIIKDRKDKGFTVLQVMLQGFIPEVPKGAILGEAFPENDPTSPNPAYFDHVDSVVEFAQQSGMILAIGLDHPRLRLTNRNTARAYGRWIGERYKGYPNIIWVVTYLIPEGENLEIMRELAVGLREVDKGHLITCHPDPAQPVATSGLAHSETWLDFNCIQTFSSVDLIPGSVIADYERIPPKPVVMAEGAYESGPEYGFDVTPYFIRKQAYMSYFSGGHHSYGHNDNWRVLPTWKASLDSPGSRQMKILTDIFTSRRWWELAPDQTVIESCASGANTYCKALRTEKGDLLIVYSSNPATYSIRMNKLAASGRLTALWINPENGAEQVIGTFSAEGVREFSTPSGQEDSLLVIETTK